MGSSPLQNSQQHKMFDTMWNRDDAALQSTLGFMLPVKAEDSLLLYYRQYSSFFFFTATCCLSFSLALRHIFLHILVQYVTNTVMVTLGAHHFFHWAVLAQPDWPWFHSLRQTLSAKSAPLKRPFVFVSLRVLKAVFVFFSRAQAESKVQKTDARQTTRHRTKARRTQKLKLCSK